MTKLLSAITAGLLLTSYGVLFDNPIPIEAQSALNPSVKQPLEPLWTVDDAVNEMRDEWIGGTVKKEEMTGEVRDFNFHIEEIDWEITPGVVVKAWAYGLEGQPATVPGPTIRVKKGDLVRIHIKNDTTQPHSLHSHGITGLDDLNDGVPHITGAYIMPNTEFTYEYVAKEAGTHWYHCHVQTSLHQDMGMYGALIVEDTEKPTWDKEFVQMVDEWDTNRGLANLTEKPNYNYFVVNGKSGMAVPDMYVKEGEIARVRLINAGFENHSLHLHGTHFVVIEKDGYQLPLPYSADTIDIAPGETYDLLVKGRDGVWPWHDHNSLDVTDKGVYPGGMLMHMRGDGNDKFDPNQTAPRIPVEGHIHDDDPHALIWDGDPQFLLEKMQLNSADWKKASAKEKARLHQQNTEFGKALDGKYDKAAGKWSFPAQLSSIRYLNGERPAQDTSENHASMDMGNTNTKQATPVSSSHIELDAMQPPVITKDAVTPLSAPVEATAFDPAAPAQPEKGQVVEVHLAAERAMMEVAPGDKRKVWTFNGQVPAPIVRVNQGDTVRITLENKDPEMSHGLDFHAGQMDMGTFHKPILPGESETFEFKANYPGLFYYHCSADPVIMHIANGMFGAVIVDPPGYKPSGKEYVVIQNEWYKAGASVQELVEGKPVAVALNGVAQHYLEHPLTAAAGENIRFYFVNAGVNDFAAWHVIGEIFDNVYLDGNPKNLRTGVQTVLVPPGGTVETDLKADAGTYLMLTHQMNDATKGGLGYLKVNAK
ncbi:multicopper oxidase domain-containing protein [Ferviditalea candida]|uniref:Copper-containing nitrite reductase n=1 Tax=Ferviditalea candida TaxID=3108399 RepID=A0ABU5ZP28_9BACL|nr:multicopper oxidase domain-containing protein [Paenibacillaceae bacterium T2]